MDVFVVQHVHIFDDEHEDVKFIGVYSSREAAAAAIERLRITPGFYDAPEGFHIDHLILDTDDWSEGYVTVAPGERL